MLQLMDRGSEKITKEIDNRHDFNVCYVYDRGMEKSKYLCRFVGDI